MCCQVAGATDPFQSRFAVAIAIEACGIFNDTVAPFALLNYRMTRSSVVGATIFPHEDALLPCLYSLTNHGYHLPSGQDIKKPASEPPKAGSLWLKVSCM